MMKSKSLVIGTLVIGSILLGSHTVAETEGHHSSGSMQPEETHEHGAIAVPSGEAIPSVDLVVHPDTLKGWNLEVRVSNFEFVPEKVNQASDNYREGHAHLYINGKKITRLYSNWYYLDRLEPGRNELSVSLNTNDHQTLQVDGKTIQDTEIVEVK